MKEAITYIPESMAKRRYYIFQSWSMAKSLWAGKPAPKEVSKLWFYWCRVRFWRYQMHPQGWFLVKINKWTRQYHFQNNFDNPTQAEVWDGMFNTLGRISKKGF